MFKKIIAGFLILVFFLHFSVTLIYNSPSNPIRAKYNSTISSYMDPVFTQNWRLFAPEPVTSNHKFFVRIKTNVRGETHTSEWIDIVDYMIKNNHDNRFTPFNRLLRIPRGAFALRHEQDETIQQMIKKINEGKIDSKKVEHLIENDRTKQTEEYSNKLLNRFAEAQLKAIYPNKDIQEFQVLLVESSPKPFSEKENNKYKIEERQFQMDWTKPSNNVTLLF